ncbi:MAG: hypothetical protein P4L64_10115 [Caulobacteraceae bacterium]|nr:hypothetical protein [Caulobacteraceae bacterium]
MIASPGGVILIEHGYCIALASAFCLERPTSGCDMQPNTFNDEPGLWMIWSGASFAFRQNLRLALVYAYERTIAAASWADVPAKIVLFGRDRELGAQAILQGWRDIGLTMPTS